MGRALLLLTLLLFLPACYHATVSTGLSPGTVKIEDKWANAWIEGLVPPETVETMERCPAGVAQVDTQLSFLNQLVAGLTLGIYTPMEIIVTCAAEGDDELLEATTKEQAARLLNSGGAFLIRLN